MFLSFIFIIFAFLSHSVYTLNAEEIRDTALPSNFNMYDRPEKLIQSFLFMDVAFEPIFMSRQLPQRPTALSLPFPYFDFTILPHPEFIGNVNVEVHMLIFGGSSKEPDVEALMAISMNGKQSYRSYVMEDSFPQIKKLADFHDKRVVFTFHCFNSKFFTAWAFHHTLHVPRSSLNTRLYRYRESLDVPDIKTFSKTHHLFGITVITTQLSKLHEKISTSATSDCYDVRYFLECQAFHTIPFHIYPYPPPDINSNKSIYDILEGFRIQGEAHDLGSAQVAPLDFPLHDRTLSVQVIPRFAPKLKFHLQVYVQMKELQMNSQLVMDSIISSKRATVEVDFLSFPAYFQSLQEIYGKTMVLLFRASSKSEAMESEVSWRWMYKLKLTQPSFISLSSNALLNSFIESFTYANQTILPLTPLAASRLPPQRVTLHDYSYEVSLVLSPLLPYQVTCQAVYHPRKHVYLLKCNNKACQRQGITLSQNMIEGVTHMRQLHQKAAILDCYMESSCTTNIDKGKFKLHFMYPIVWDVPFYLLDEALPLQKNKNNVPQLPSWIPSSMTQVYQIYQNMMIAFCKLKSSEEATSWFNGIPKVAYYQHRVLEFVTYFKKLFFDKEERCQLFSEAPLDKYSYKQQSTWLIELNIKIYKHVHITPFKDDHAFQNDLKTDEEVLKKTAYCLGEMILQFRQDLSIWRFLTYAYAPKQFTQNGYYFLLYFAKLTYLQNNHRSILENKHKIKTT